MAVSSEYKTYIEELFEGFGTVKIKPMFGGAGIFAPLPEGDLMFGLIASDTVYLKVDDSNRPDFDAEGAEAFSYETSKGKRGLMSYYALPEFLYDEPNALTDWAHKALDVAIKAKKPKKRARSNTRKSKK